MTTIEIRTRGFKLTAGLRDHVERRVGFALDRFADRISRATVTLSDVNGPRGGADKACAITLHVRRAGPVRVADRDPDLHVCVDRATHRIARVVARSVHREREQMGHLLTLANLATGSTG